MRQEAAPLKPLFAGLIQLLQARSDKRFPWFPQRPLSGVGSTRVRTTWPLANVAITTRCSSSSTTTILTGFLGIQRYIQRGEQRVSAYLVVYVMRSM